MSVKSTRIVRAYGLDGCLMRCVFGLFVNTNSYSQRLAAEVWKASEKIVTQARGEEIIIMRPWSRAIRRGLKDTSTLLSPQLHRIQTHQRQTLQNLERTLVQMGADEKHTAVLRDTLATSVFLICTVGEFNAGKSTMLNALLGGSFCKIGVLPTTEAITLLRHGPFPAADVTAAVAATSVDDGSGGNAGSCSSSPVVTVDVPTPWLRDVSVVDTPGTNSLEARHSALTQDFLPRADLLLFVTSAERPFSESEQTFLRAIRAWGKKVLFVLNKAGLLTAPSDLEKVVDYVATHGAIELGEAVSVLPVDAKTALTLKERAADGAVAEGEVKGEAGSGGGGRSALALGAPLLPHARDATEQLAASQWEALEGRVLRVIGSDEQAAAKLRSQRSLADAILRTYEARQRKEVQLVASDLEVISEARRRLDVWARETESDLEAQQARVRMVLHGLQQRGHDFLNEELQLSMLPRLLRRDDFVDRFQRQVLSSTSDELQAVVASVAAWMDARGAAQAAATAELLSVRLQQPAGGDGHAEGDRGGRPLGVGSAATAAATASSFASQRQLLLLQLQTSATKAVDTFDSATAAQRMVTAAQAAVAQAAVLTSGAAGLSGLVAVKAAALVDLTGLLPAALLAGVGLGVLPMQRHRLQTEYREKTDELANTLDRAVRAHLTQELQGARDRCDQLVTPFATLVGSAHTQQEERLKALEASRAALNELAADLARVVPGAQE